jgi:LTXXQ motif family protein
MKTNRIVRLSLSILMLLPVALLAQDRKDKIETMHIAYLSQRLNLTSAQAEKFWPIYNEFRAEQDKLRKERMDNMQTVRKAGGIDSMSDADVQKLVNSETDIETKQLEVRKEYVVKFQQAIPLRKVAKFFVAEEEFKHYLLNELKHRDHDGRGRGDDDGPPPPPPGMN